MMIKNGLSGNQLKLIALITMTVDHIGAILFPQNILLRIIGRLAFPIYAYMIAEGCRYTRNYGKYLGLLAGVAVLCQGVYFVALRSLYQYIMVTFSLSVALIWLVRRAVAKKSLVTWLAAGMGVLAVLFVTEGLPLLLKGTDFYVDYGFLGVMLPVCIYCGRNKTEKLVLAALVLSAISLDTAAVQWVSLLAVPLLALYSGRRGKWKMKYFFYFYYPVHLVAIHFIRVLFF